MSRHGARLPPRSARSGRDGQHGNAQYARYAEHAHVRAGLTTTRAAIATDAPPGTLMFFDYIKTRLDILIN